MSVRKSPYIKTALFEKVNVSEVTDIATGGVYLDSAGLRTSYPFLIIEKVTAMPIPTFQTPSAIEESYWNLKAFAEAVADKSAQEQGEEIIDVALDTLGDTLDLLVGTCMDVRWDADLPTLRQPVPNKIVYMTGVRLKIVVSHESLDYLHQDGDYWTQGGEKMWQAV